MLLQAEQMHKMTSISLKIVKVVILNENSCHFVSCSACSNIYFLLSLRYVTCEMGQLLKFNTENEDPSKLQNSHLNYFVCQAKQFRRKLVNLLEGLK